MLKYLNDYEKYLAVKERLYAEQTAPEPASAQSSTGNFDYLALIKPAKKSVAHPPHPPQHAIISHQTLRQWMAQHHPRVDIEALARAYSENIQSQAHLLYDGNITDITELHTAVTELITTITVYEQEQQQAQQRAQEERVRVEFEAQQRILSAIPDFSSRASHSSREYRITADFARQFQCDHPILQDFVVELFLEFIQNISSSSAAAIAYARGESAHESCDIIGTLAESAELAFILRQHFNLLAQLIYWEILMRDEMYSSADRIISARSQCRESYDRNFHNELWPTLRRAFNVKQSQSVAQCWEMVFKFLSNYSLLSCSRICDALDATWHDGSADCDIRQLVIETVTADFAVPFTFILLDAVQKLSAICTVPMVATSSAHTPNVKLSFAAHALLEVANTLGICAPVEQTQTCIIKPANSTKTYTILSSAISRRGYQSIFQTFKDEFFAARRPAKNQIDAFLNLDAHVGLAFAATLVNPFIFKPEDSSEYAALMHLGSAQQKAAARCHTLHQCIQAPPPIESENILSKLNALQKRSTISSASSSGAASVTSAPFAQRVHTLIASIRALKLEMKQEHANLTLNMLTAADWRKYASEHVHALDLFSAILLTMDSLRQIDTYSNELVFSEMWLSSDIRTLIKTYAVPLKQICEIILKTHQTGIQINAYLQNFIRLSLVEQKTAILHLAIYVLGKTLPRAEAILFPQLSPPKAAARTLQQYEIHHGINAVMPADPLLPTAAVFDEIYAFIAVHLACSYDLAWSTPKYAALFRLKSHIDDAIMLTSVLGDFTLRMPTYARIRAIVQEYVRPLLLQLEAVQTREMMPVETMFQLECNLHNLYATIDHLHFEVPTPVLPVEEIVYLTGLIAFCKYFTSNLVEAWRDGKFCKIVFHNQACVMTDVERVAFYRTLLMLDFTIMRQCCLPMVQRNVNFKTPPLPQNESLALQISVDMNREYAICLRAIRIAARTDEEFAQRLWFFSPDNMMADLAAGIDDVEFVGKYMLTNCSVAAQPFEEDSDAWLDWFYAQAHLDVPAPPKGGRIFLLNFFMSQPPNLQ